MQRQISGQRATLYKSSDMSVQWVKQLWFQEVVAHMILYAVENMMEFKPRLEHVPDQRNTRLKFFT